jgi:hypothetical protein
MNGTADGNEKSGTAFAVPKKYIQCMQALAFI